MRKETVEAVLRDLDMPQVDSWHVETGRDATDDVAVWVWVTLSQEDTDSLTRSELRNRIRQAIEKSFSQSPPWVYVRFRTVVEMAEI